MTGISSHTHTRGKPSQPSQEEDKQLKVVEKMGCEGSASTLANPRNPRKPAKGKAKGRKAKPKKPRTAADLRIKERVPASAEDGVMQGAERFVDTVEMMYRRRQIDARQYQAAEAYREAVERVEGGIPCPLDTSRVRGGGIATSPTEAQLWAAGMLGEAERILGKIDGRIVALVVSGMGLREVALAIFGSEKGQARRGDWEHVGRRLREALACLADSWWPAPPVGRIRAVRDETPVSDGLVRTGAIEAGRVAHASRGRVRFSD